MTILFWQKNKIPGKDISSPSYLLNLVECTFCTILPDQKYLVSDDMVSV